MSGQSPQCCLKFGAFKGPAQQALLAPEVDLLEVHTGKRHLEWRSGGRCLDDLDKCGPSDDEYQEAEHHGAYRERVFVLVP